MGSSLETVSFGSGVAVGGGAGVSVGAAVGTGVDGGILLCACHGQREQRRQAQLQPRFLSQSVSLRTSPPLTLLCTMPRLRIALIVRNGDKKRGLCLPQKNRREAAVHPSTHPLRTNGRPLSLGTNGRAAPLSVHPERRRRSRRAPPLSFPPEGGIQRRNAPTERPTGGQRQ